MSGGEVGGVGGVPAAGKRGDVIDDGGARLAAEMADAGERTVPLIGRLRADLARHKLATGRDGDDLCFGLTATQAFVRSTLRARALAAWQRAGLEALTPHEARHTCASYLAAAGLTPKEAQTAMGHADIRTTMTSTPRPCPAARSRQRRSSMPTSTRRARQSIP